MSNKSPTTLVLVIIGVAVGFCIQLVAVAVGLPLLMGIDMALNPAGASEFHAEGLFWGFLLALLSTPAGMVTGAVTGLAGIFGARTWLQMTLVGTIPALLGGFAAFLPFLSMGQPNFIVPVTVSIASVLVAVVVARIGSSKRRVE